MTKYLWRVKYLKYREAQIVTVVASSIPQIFKLFSSKLKKQYVTEAAVISIEREDAIDWIQS